MVIGAPPLNAGAEYDTRSLPEDGSMPVIVGASGARDGVPVAELLAVPGPAAFTARILTAYWVPFVSPVMTSGEDVEAGDLVVQLVPSKECS